MALSDGLVGYWSPWLGSSGYRLLDRTRYANHGTLTNMDAGTDWVGATIQGRSGYALDFDATNDFVSLGDTWSNTIGTGDFSIGAWFYPRSTLTAQVLLGKDSASGRAWILEVNVANGAYSAGCLQITVLPNNTNYGWRYTGNVLTVNKWQFITAGRRNGTLFVSLDGKEQSTTLGGTAPEASAIQSTTTQTRLGSRAYSGFEGYFNGQVSDAFAFNRGLRTSEIQNIFMLNPGWYRPYSKRSIGYPIAGFKAYWHRRETQIIGGGLR